MDEQHIAARQQRASDYFLENERLTGDLTDDQSRPLISWASERARHAAAEPALTDEALDHMLRRIRRAVLEAARAAPAEHDAARLVERAEQVLRDAGERGA
jgi:predicted ArsR family transcriptional regulator